MIKSPIWTSALTLWPRRYPAVFAVFGLLIICVLFFHQPLFSGEIVNATDILTQQYFWNSFIKENLFADPCFQTWLPYVNAGTPFSGGLDLLFRPVTFLTLLLLPVHVALNYEMIIYIFLLGVGMYFYMRELDISPLSAFLAALVLMLNGEIVTLLNAGHVNKIGAIAPLTFVFWALERALRQKTIRAFIVTGVVLGIQFWQGHVQISFYTCIAVAIYYLVRISVLLKQEKNVRLVGRLTAYAVLMVIVFLLLSAVTFLPLISFAQVSDRAEGVSYEFATSWSMPPEELLTYIIPGVFGLRRANHFEDEPDIQQVEYWGRMPFTQTGRYFGILPLLLMLLALVCVRNRHVLAFATLALVILLLGMGQYIPTYQLLYKYVPGFNQFRAPQMILFLFAFATSGLVGFGSEWLLTAFSPQKENRLRNVLVILIGIWIVCGLLTMILPQIQEQLLSKFHDAFFRKGATPEVAVIRFKNMLRGFLWFDVVFGLAIVLIGLRLMQRLRIKWLVTAMLLMFLGDIWLFNEKYIDTVRLEGSLYVSSNDAIRYFQANPGVYRILPLTNEPVTYSTFNKYVLYKLFSVSGYEAVGVQYYNEYLENMPLGSPMVDLLNIKYLIFPKGAQFGDQQVSVGQTVGPYKVVLDADAIVLENLKVLPRAYPVHQAYVIPEAQERLGALNDPQFNPREAVILEDYPQVQLAPTNLPSAQSQAELTHYLNRTIQVKATMATDGFLVLSEKYYAGWKAYVDGHQTPIYRANHTLQAIIVPQGEHQITFAFQPPHFLKGFALTIITSFGLCGAWWYDRQRRKRSDQPLQHSLFRSVQTIVAERLRVVKYPNLIAIGVFFMLSLMTITQHEMWRDELRAWDIARTAHSLPEVFHNLRSDGHPAFWHLCLYVLKQLVPNPVVMQMLHVIVATAVAYIFLRWSPFPYIQRLLFIFGYFPFYEYAVISRNYALGFLGLFAFCALYPLRPKRYLWMSSVLFLVCQTNLYALIIVMALLCLLILDLFRKNDFWETVPGKRKELIMSLCVILVGIGLSVLQLIPAKDSTTLSAWRTTLHFEPLKQALATVWNGYVPIPPLRMEFWNTNLLQNVEGIRSLFGLLLLLLSALCFVRTPSILLVFLMGTFGILSFAYIKFIGHLRHHGHFFMLFIICLWLAAAHPPVKIKWFSGGLQSVDRYKKPFITVLLLAHLIAALIAVPMEWVYPFSTSKAVAAFIKNAHLQDQFLVGDPDHIVASVAGHLGQALYYPMGERFATFPVWDAARRMQKSPETYFDQALRLASQAKKDVILILNYEMAASAQGVTALERFTRSIVPDERFYLYQIRSETLIP